MADIATLTVPKTDVTKSVLLGLGIAAGAFVVVVAAYILQCDNIGAGDC